MFTMARLMAAACVWKAAATPLGKDAKKALVIVDAQACNMPDTTDEIALAQVTRLLETGNNGLEWDMVIFVNDEHPKGKLASEVYDERTILEYDLSGRLCQVDSVNPNGCNDRYTTSVTPEGETLKFVSRYHRRIYVPNQNRQKFCRIGTDGQKIMSQLPRRKGDIVLSKGIYRGINSMGAFENAFENAVNTQLNTSMEMVNTDAEASHVWINNPARQWSAIATETRLHSWLLTGMITEVFFAGSNHHKSIDNTIKQAQQIEERRTFKLPNEGGDLEYYRKIGFHVITDAVIGTAEIPADFSMTNVAVVVAGFKPFVAATANVDSELIYIGAGAGVSIIAGALIFFGMNMVSDEGKMD